MSRPITKGIAALAAIALFVLGAYKILERPIGGPCWALREISNDPVQNESLRIGLTEFLNDPAIRLKLDGVPYHSGFIMGNDLFFDAPFPWISVFDAYPEFDFLVKSGEIYLLILLDTENGKLSPPYRFSEVGVYAGRSIIMYNNEISSPYTGGKGADTLSQKSYVKCELSADSIYSSER